jgi:hypothetical protein
MPWLEEDGGQMDKPIIAGSKLKKIDREIDGISELIRLLNPKVLEKVFRNHRDIRNWIGDVERSELFNIRQSLIDKVDGLILKREKVVNGDPGPEQIICPHCNYDGEFEEGRPKNALGFRLLEPVLSPRLILRYQNQRLALSDLDEGCDQFDSIADPEYKPGVDDEPSEDYQRMREILRGKYLIVCGSCFKYFSAEGWIAKVHIEYTGESPHESRWRKPQPKKDNSNANS